MASKVRLEREIVLSALSGAAGNAPVHDLIRKGLENFRRIRYENRLSISAALDALRKSKTGRDYVQIGLPRGATARLPLGSELDRQSPLVIVLRSRGSTVSIGDAGFAAAWLAQRVGTNVEAAMKLLLGIERARKRCYELCEEATRWL